MQKPQCLLKLILGNDPSPLPYSTGHTHKCVGGLHNGVNTRGHGSLGATLEAGYPQDKSCYASMAESQSVCIHFNSLMFPAFLILSL